MDDEWIDAATAMIRFSVGRSTIRLWRHRYGVRICRPGKAMLYHFGDLAAVEARTRTNNRAKHRIVIQAEKALRRVDCEDQNAV